jgi:hypothetical protein
MWDTLGLIKYVTSRHFTVGHERLIFDTSYDKLNRE